VVTAAGAVVRVRAGVADRPAEGGGVDLVVAGGGAVVVARLLGDADGTGGGDVGAPPRRSIGTRAPSSGAAVRSTGSIATEASAMLLSVAAHQPSTGTHVREDGTRP
jgi:hypothetical protein